MVVKISEKNETTSSLKIDISDFKKGITDAKRQIRMANAEFKEATAGMDKWGESADGISAKLQNLEKTLDAEKKILSNLEEQYKAVVEEQGENSKGAEELAIKIANEKAAIKKVQKEIGDYTDKLEDLNDGNKDAEESGEDHEKTLEKVEKQSEKTGSATKELTKNLASLAVKGIKAAVTAGAGLVTSFIASAEATREYRVALGKVETAFTSSNFTAEQGKKTFKELNAVLGDTDRATEAAGNLAKLCNSEKELTDWTTIATGVYGSFGDGLPIESLAEAANETAKVAQVTGPLADALNWVSTDTEVWNKALASNETALAAFQKGIADGENAEDSFTLALQACSSEQERSQLITATLTSLYSDAAGAYEKTNGAIIDANRAQEELDETMAEVGATAEPVVTTFKKMGTEVLTSALPGIKDLAKGFTDLLKGTSGADKKIGTAVGSIVNTILGKATEALPGILTIGVSMITALISGLIQEAPNMLAAGEDLIKQIVSMIAKSAPQLLETIQSLATAIFEELTTSIPKVLDFGAQLITKLGEGIGSNLPAVINKALDVLNGFADMLAQNAPTIINAGISFIQNLAQGIADSLPTLIQRVPEIVTKLANVINDNAPTILKAGVNIIITLAKGIIQAIPTLVKNIPKIIKAIVAVWEAFNWLNLGKKAITFLKDGIVSAISAVKSAGKSVLDAITNTIKDLPGKLLDFGKKGISGIGEAFKAGIDSVKNIAKDILTKIVNTFKPDSLKDIGKQLITGLWNGISDMTGWILDKIKGFTDDVVNKIKKHFGIHSPSTVMRDQVGKYISLGIAEGIKQNKNAVTKTTKELSDSVLASLKRNMSEKDFKSTGSKLVSKLNEGITEQISSFTTSITSVTKTYKTLISNVEKKQKEALSKLSTEYKSNLKEIKDKYDNLIKEVETRQDNLASKMSGADALYTIDSDGNLTLGDIEQQTKDIEMYGSKLNELKKKVSSELMDQILSMNVDDANKYMDALNKMSDAELQKYDDDYNKKIRESNKIAYKWYKDDIKELKADYKKEKAALKKEYDEDVKTTNAKYQKEINTLKKQYTTKVESLFNNLTKNVSKAGTNALNGFLKAFKGKSDVEKTLSEFCNNVAKTIKDKFKIHSPSKVMEEIGKFLTLGMGEGITKNKPVIDRAWEQVKTSVAKPISLDIEDAKARVNANRTTSNRNGSNDVNNTSYTFNQYNSSPKALSRLEIYRQTKNQLDFAKGV